MVDEYEWQTRRDRINKKLQSLKPAWKIIKYASDLDVSSLNGHAVEEYPTANGPADYALFAKGRLLGISKPKGQGRSAKRSRTAKRYAKEPMAAAQLGRIRGPFYTRPTGEVTGSSMCATPGIFPEAFLLPHCRCHDRAL